jgi:hypothetical protein
LLITGGTISSGTVRTFGVCGVYWISSRISLRNTTAPGVAATVVPSSNAVGSTMLGTRGAVARSRTRLRAPATELSPAVSISAFQATGLTSGLLLGASASTRLSTTKPIRCRSRHSSCASAVSAPAVSAAAR